MDELFEAMGPSQKSKRAFELAAGFMSSQDRTNMAQTCAKIPGLHVIKENSAKPCNGLVMGMNEWRNGRPNSARAPHETTLWIDDRNLILANGG